MPLTLSQRLERLRVRLSELPFWLTRASVDLDAWTVDGAPLELGAPWPTLEGVRTFEHPVVAVPDPWPLDETRLELDLGGESLLVLEYEDGAESFGVDPYHQLFPLQARRFSVRAESVARLPFGVPNRAARLARARITWLERDLETLIRRLELVHQAATALAHEEVADALVGCAERALRGLEWPSATRDYLARIAEGGDMRRLWRAPGGLPEHPAGLSDAHRESVREALGLLNGELRALQARYPQKGALLLVGHAHLDLAWLWPLDETARKARRTFSGMLALMARDPEFTFTHSTAQVYAWLEEEDPALLEGVRTRVREGRWEPLGGMWVEPDLNMPTGESLARQLLYGQRFFERVFGARHTVAWLPDCFGFTGALPQLLKGAGIHSFFTTKTNWNETNRFPYDLFWWEGPDGARVLAHTFDNPFQKDAGGYNGLLDPSALHHTWANYRGKHTHPEGLLTIGYGDGGGGTTPEMLAVKRDLEAFPRLPKTRFGRVTDFFRELHKAARRQDLPTWLGEIYLELHRGTLTTQGRTKWLHRRAERELLAAEVLGGLLHLAGGERPTSQEPLWRLLLRNQFHDILPGSSIREVYERSEAELAEVVQGAEARSREAVRALAQKLVPAGDGAEAQDGLFVVNADLSEKPLRATLSERVAGAQAVDEGFLVSSPHPVPGLSAVVLLDPPPPGALSVSERGLENALLRVELHENGTLARVYDKRHGREVLSGRGNQLWAYVDKPRAWDAWDIDAGYAEQGEEITALSEVTVVEEGPHRASVRLTRPFRNSTITQEVRLWADSARLEFSTTLDWRDRRWLLKARFPLNVRAQSATYETAFGVTERATHRNTPWDAARFEVAGHRFADLAEPGYGVALLNDGRYGYHAHPSELGLSLLRAPVFPDTLADEGAHTLTYALLPHAGDWLTGGVLAEAEDLNRPLFARPVQANAPRVWRPLVVTGLPLALGALKPAEEGPGLVLRLYEPQGARGAAPLTLPKGWRAEAVNVLEDPLGDASADDPVFTPFQVRSWRLVRS
jgi:alpha-mannosidase